MSVFKITHYLKKFSLLSPPDESIKKQLQQLIKEKIGVDVETQAIEVKNKNIYITTSPIIKNEIFMQKNNLIQEVNKATPKGEIKDIL